MPLKLNIITKFLKVDYSQGKDTLAVKYEDVEKARQLNFETDEAKKAFVAGGVAAAVFGFTTFALRRSIPLNWLPFRLGSVIYETTIPSDKEAEFDDFVASKQLENELQQAFAQKEAILKEMLGESFAEIGQKALELLANVEVTSVNLCDKEGRPVTPQKKEKANLSGKSAIRLLPVTGLRVRAVPNRQMRNKPVVFFDDPNATIANKSYEITAWDAEGGTKLEQVSGEPYVTLKGLQPGRSYLIFVEVVVDDLRSDKTFHGELIQTYHDDYLYGSPTSSADKTPSVQTEESDPTEDSGIGSSSARGERHPSATEEQRENREGAEGKPMYIIYKDTVAEIKKSFRSALGLKFNGEEAKLEELLKKCDEYGVENFADLNYLRGDGILEEAFQPPLKMVEMGKLRAYLRDMYGDSEADKRRYANEDYGYQRVPRKQLLIGSNKLVIDKEFMDRLQNSDADVTIQARTLVT